MKRKNYYNITEEQLDSIPEKDSKKIFCGAPIFDFNLAFIPELHPIIRTRPNKKLFDKVNTAYQQLREQGYLFAEGHVELEEVVLFGLGKERSMALVQNNDIEQNHKFFFMNKSNIDTIPDDEIIRNTPIIKSNTVKDATLSILERIINLLPNPKDTPSDRLEIEEDTLNEFINYFIGEINIQDFLPSLVEAHQKDLVTTYIKVALAIITEDLYDSIENLTSIQEASNQIHKSKGHKNKKLTKGINDLIDRCIENSLTMGQTFELIRMQASKNNKGDVSDKTASKWIKARLPSNVKLSRSDNIEAKTQATPAFEKLRSSIEKGVYSY